MARRTMATEQGEFTLRGRAEVVGGTSSVLLKEKADAVLSPRREDGEHDAHPHNCPDEPMVGPLTVSGFTTPILNGRDQP